MSCCIPKVIQSPLEKVRDLVTFQNISDSYDTGEDILVTYTLDPEVKGSSRDWIGIFDEEYTSFENYVAFEWGLGRRLEHNSPQKRQVFFESKFFSKNINFKSRYKFVYINKLLEVLGESSLFEFTSQDSRADQTFTIISDELFETPDTPVKENNFDKAQNENKNEYCCENNRKNELKYAESFEVNNCLLNTPGYWKTSYTYCSKCKKLSAFINKNKNLEAELEHSAIENHRLKCRIIKLEGLLDKCIAQHRETHFNGYEETKFERFVTEMMDAAIPQIPVIHYVNESSTKYPKDVEDIDYSTMNKRELFLKSIIGQQEEKIKRLNHLLLEANKSKAGFRTTAICLDEEVYETYVEDVVEVFQADKPMEAEVMDIDSNSN